MIESRPVADTGSPDDLTVEVSRGRSGVVAFCVRHADRLIPAVAFVVFFAGFFIITWLKSYTLEPGYDRAYFKQAVWLINHGQPLFISPRGLYLLGDHASPLIYPVAWVARFLPLGAGLLLIQAVAIGTGAVYLYRFAREHAGLSVGLSTALLGALAVYPALHNTALAGFHPEAIAFPAFIAATFYGLRGQWWRYAAAFAVILTAKEDMAIAGVSLAFLLFVKGRRKAAGVTFVVGSAYLVFAMGYLSPHFAGDQYVQTVRFAGYGEGMGEILRFMISHPVRVWTDVFSPETTTKLVALLGPLLFLPLLAPAYLAPALGLEFILLATNYGPPHTIDFHYTMAFTAFAFMATAVTLSRLELGVLSRRKLGVALLAAGAFFFVQYAKDSPLHHPWQWRTRDAVDEARLAAHRMIPRGDAVTVGNGLLDLFSDRQFVYNAPMPFEYYTEIEPDPIPMAERRRHVDWAVIDQVGEWVMPKPPAEVIDQVLPAWGFEVVWEREGIVVMKRISRPDAPIALE